MKTLGTILLCIIVALVMMLLFGRAVDHELDSAVKPRIGTALVCQVKGNRIWCGNPNSKRARVKRPDITVYLDENVVVLEEGVIW